MIHTKEKRRLCDHGSGLTHSCRTTAHLCGPELAVPGKALSYILSETKEEKEILECEADGRLDPSYSCFFLLERRDLRQRRYSIYKKTEKERRQLKFFASLYLNLDFLFFSNGWRGESLFDIIIII